MVDRRLEVLYTAHARRDLLKLDKRLASRIVLKIREYTSSPDPLHSAQPLSGVLAGRYRYRIGDYRAIFRIDRGGVVSILTILRIKHRKDVYR